MAKEYLGKQTVASLIRLVKNEFTKYAKKTDVTEQLGDIETALDSIIAIQENLIGGDEA
jgi:hypothetical protein